MHERAVDYLSSADRVLARLIQRVGPCRMRADRKSDPFQSLVRAVAHQQLTGKAAKTILGRLIALHPHVDFPAPHDLLANSDDQLRSVGFSRAKVAALKDIAAKTVEGIVPETKALGKLSDAEIIERLTSIRGVGQWTVEMLLIFKLGRLDVLPVHDYGVRKGFASTYRRKELPKPAELLKHGERWRPFRSVASWYMWRALELE
ncbi:MAG: DNA-3-methyladenine glycosylase [Verrucomicrobiota bacterium]|jgi:3-methyladenine DNA glycosylase/8-oxoguanine DNA glycosylase